MREYSHWRLARSATWRRISSEISVATGENLAGFGFGHSQNLLQLHEMIELRFFLCGCPLLPLLVDQFLYPFLSLGRQARRCSAISL
jgi:hypothetical protein